MFRQNLIERDAIRKFSWSSNIAFIVGHVLINDSGFTCRIYAAGGPFRRGIIGCMISECLDRELSNLPPRPFVLGFGEHFGLFNRRVQHGPFFPMQLNECLQFGNFRILSSCPLTSRIQPAVTFTFSPFPQLKCVANLYSRERVAYFPPRKSFQSQELTGRFDSGRSTSPT